MLVILPFVYRQGESGHRTEESAVGAEQHAGDSPDRGLLEFIQYEP
jgi:hypothetical protein